MDLPDAAALAALLDGRYQIGAVLGRGGQGIVYRAHRTRGADGAPADDDVALKFHFDPRQDERVAREIRVMQSLQHPCLANLIEHGVLDDCGQPVRYIAWEYISGQPLSDRLASGPVGPRVTAIVGRDVAIALSHVWAARVVHRDVNPKNIMLRTGDRAAVLIDLGVARHLAQSALTTAGSTWGTPGYMSPEQARGEQQLTCFSDVFTLGVTLTHALTGAHPTGGRQDLLMSQPLRPSDTLAALPGGLTRLLDQMLLPRAVQRPTPAKVAEHLAALVPLL